ncbi:NUDIX domain-containing protein [bacterium]|nr:NUDIX domain-containing protein [bacterium]
MFTIGVFAIIFDDKNRILFCHRTDYDLWNLPGGRLEKGEAPWKGVIREAKEETGLDVEVVKMTGIYSKPNTDDIVLQFVCKAIGGKITLNEEADKIKYFAFADIPNNTVPKQIPRIKDVLDNPDEFHMKEQFGKSTKELIKEGLL